MRILKIVAITIILINAILGLWINNIPAFLGWAVAALFAFRVFQYEER
jgi:hypothetical protein